MQSKTFDLFHLNEETSKQIYDVSSDSVTLDFVDILGFDEEYAQHLLNNPDQEMQILSGAASQFAERRVDLHISSLPETMNIHHVKRDYFYHLVQVRGTVMQRSDKFPNPAMITYECPCGEEIKLEQTEQWRTYPEKCRDCDGRKNFKALYDKTTFDECQWIEIQELAGNIHLSDTPSKIRVLLRNSLIDSCTPGETVTLVGIPKVLEKKPNPRVLKMGMYLDCHGLINDTEEENFDLTKEDVEKLRELAANENHLQNVIQSFAPTVYGEDIIKEALAYQQCEGNTKQLTKKKRRRGQLHILLAGPPGVAKSDLGEYQVLYHHKGRQATGRGASSVGLTASVVQENGEWTLKAGAMSLADNGLLFVDEIEKMRSEDSGMMHPGMEAQEMQISKAGINATVKTRCSIVAACNPVGGRWHDNKDIVGNLIDKGKGLTIPLLNRFALIFVVKEKDTEEEEAEVVDHIFNVSTDFEEIQPPYDEETLRKLFIYARTFKPKLTKESSVKLKEFYLTLFKVNKAQDRTILSRRQVEDLIRISEASAKLHLREEVTLEDAENAVRVMAESVKQYGVDPLTGDINQTAVFYGQPTTVTSRIRQLPDIVKRVKIQNPGKTHVSRIDLVEYTCNLWKEDEGYVEKLITIALRDGLLYCPLPGMVSVTD